MPLGRVAGQTERRALPRSTAYCPDGIRVGGHSERTRGSQMATDDQSAVDDLGGLADLTAAEASAFLTSVTEVASGNAPDTALPVLSLALSQVLVAGARLGAIQDVVLEERFEADPGADDDVDP